MTAARSLWGALASGSATAELHHHRGRDQRGIQDPDRRYQFPIIEVQGVAIEVATEIFTRINVGGKPLSVFEISASSRLWSPRPNDEAKGFDLSQEFDALVERLQQIDCETIPMLWCCN